MPGILHDLAHQRKAVGVHAGRRKPDHRVARRDIRPRQQRAALGRADRKAGEVVVAVLVEAGHLGGLAADQRAAGFPAAFGDAGDDRSRSLRVELSAGEIVEKEQRLGALHHDVVDRHRDEVDADAAMQAGVDGDLELGADAVGGGHQHRVLEARGLEVEQAAKAADFGIGAGAARWRGPSA